MEVTRQRQMDRLPRCPPPEQTVAVVDTSPVRTGVESSDTKDVQPLRAEVDQLRQEVASLRQKVDDLWKKLSDRS